MSFQRVSIPSPVFSWTQCSSRPWPSKDGFWKLLDRNRSEFLDYDLLAGTVGEGFVRETMTFQGDVIGSHIVSMFIFIKGKSARKISLGVNVWSRLDCDFLIIESQQSCGKRSWSSLVGPCFTSVSLQRDCGCRLHFPSVWKIHQL